MDTGRATEKVRGSGTDAEQRRVRPMRTTLSRRFG
jgi:hypothetical protein